MFYGCLVNPGCVLFFLDLQIVPVSAGLAVRLLSSFVSLLPIAHVGVTFARVELSLFSLVLSKKSPKSFFL